MKINRLIKTEKDARRELPERVARLADAAIQNNAKATRQGACEWRLISKSSATLKRIFRKI
jgi:hypothetical protein